MVVTIEELNGRCRELSISADLTIDETVKLWYVTASVAGLKIKMPDATRLKAGGAHFVVVIKSGSNSVTIADNAGTPILTTDGTSTLTALTRGLVLLLVNTSAAGSWIVKKDAVTVATNPTPIEFTYQSGGSNTTGSNNLKLRRYNHQ